MPRCRTVFWCCPECLTFSSWSKCSNFNALRRSKLLLFLNFSKTLTNTRSMRIINIDVCAWSRIICFYWFIARSVLTSSKRNGYSFFLQKSLLYIIFFLTCKVLARTGILYKRRFGKRSIKFIFPHISTICSTQEWILCLCKITWLISWFFCKFASNTIRITITNQFLIICTWAW